MSKLSLYILLCVVAAVTAAAQPNPITLNPAALSFAYQTGSATLPAAQTMQIQTSPVGVSYTVDVSGSPFNAAWLLVSASAGKSPGSLKVQVNPTGLPAGAYSGMITISATVNSQAVTQNATVALTVTTAPPTIAVTPALLNFSYTSGGPIPAPSLSSNFVISSSGSAISAVVSAKAATWLSVTPTGSVSLVGLFNTITVTANPTGLAPKVYTGQISISAPASVNKTLTVNVTLTVNAGVPTVTGTWPGGVIQGSPASVVTMEGSNFFSTSTVSATGFTRASTITVSDGSNTASETFYIPSYQASATKLRLGVASPMPSGTVGVGYSKALTAAGGTGPFAYTLVGGAVPTGLFIAGSNIIGTPLAAGSYLAVIQVTDSAATPSSAYAQLKITIDPPSSSAIRIRGAAAPLGIGTVGVAYGPVTLTAAGGTGGLYTWTATNLPPGFALTPSGVLSGTPATDGSFGTTPATVVSDSAILAIVPSADLASPGVLRIVVNTPAPGGGTSNEGQFQVYGTGPQILAVTNGASLAQGTLAPGELITLFGMGLGPQIIAVFDPSTPPIPSSLPATGSATSVTINGTPAPLIYTMASQVGAIVPYSISGSTAQVVASYGGIASSPFTVAVAPVDPGVYSLFSSGQGPGAILNYNATTMDYTVNSAAAAAAKGSTVVIYITGAGATTSPVYNQLIPASPAVTPILTPTLSIGGQSATVTGAQAPPGSVPGLIQVNATVPATAPVGAAVAVIVTIGGVSSQTGLTMAVK